MSGTLYVVATPLGNLEDITLRALRILREVALVACEDTRRTRILLTHFGIQVSVTSYFEHNKLRKGARLLETLRAGQSVALVTDAGTPGISDPGFRLVRQAREAGVPVVPVPGPSAVVTALSAAGLPADRFVFEGFLPVKPGRRIHRLEALRDLEMTVVCYESPHRILATLDAVGQVWGDRVNEIDLRIAKNLTFGRVRTNVGLDMFNLINSNAILTYNQTYSPTGPWLAPQSVLSPRFFKISAQIDF